ncbi:NYN domain-containing protein [Candidatus Pacearchaeota archaeon]|nr:NYN domain-containing protein [Candidatus Pacearchaeota archaeon]
MLKKNNQTERIIFFIDGNNLYHIVKRMLPSKRQIEFNFRKFADFLAEGRKLVNVYYYTAPLDKSYDEEGYMKQQKFFDLLQRIPDFKLVLCRMQKVKIDGKIVYQVKEDDIHLAVDMVKLAYKNTYDTAVLVSSDGDFVPAVLAVKEIGKNVENIGFENVFSYHLKQECDRFRKLSKKEVAQFF